MNVAKDFFATLVLRGADPSYNNSVPALRWNVERLGRLTNGFFLVVGLDSAETFSAMADHIDRPSRHSALRPAHHPNT